MTEEDIKNLTFMGMVGFIDPIRPEAVNSIEECIINSAPKSGIVHEVYCPIIPLVENG